MKGIRDLTKDSRTVKEKHDDYFRFTITNMAVEDSGTYSVVVKNKFGIDRAFITVRVSTIEPAGRRHELKLTISYIVSISLSMPIACIVFAASTLPGDNL